MHRAKTKDRARKKAPTIPATPPPAAHPFPPPPPLPEAPLPDTLIACVTAAGAAQADIFATGGRPDRRKLVRLHITAQGQPTSIPPMSFVELLILKELVNRVAEVSASDVYVPPTPPGAPQ